MAPRRVAAYPGAMNAPLPALSDGEIAEVVCQLCRALGDDGRAAPEVARRRLRARLTALPPGEVPPQAWPMLDALWAAEAARRTNVRAANLPRLAASGWASRVSLWQGDITALEVDAIVNAANSGLTGCYQPFHACVDNAIHTAAGPRLREECGRIMALRNRPEPTATATPTGGHFLPARYVVHTVGPIVRGPVPNEGDERALRACYSACLEAAASLPEAKGLAFCGISTGVFGYPTALAAPVAIATVRSFLEQEPRIEQVVLVTYSAADQAEYSAMTQELLRA